MTTILHTVSKGLSDFAQLRDYRAIDLPFVSAVDMALLTAGYTMLVYWGPRIMATRKAFHLRAPIMLYNLLQVALNVTLFSHSVYQIANYPTTYVWQCSAPFTDSGSYYARIELGSVYAYHVLKVVDLLDTVFFVLRKKTDQMTFLHVYHHIGIAWGTWLAMNFHPGGHFSFLGMINTMVHSIMYAYYFASLYRPQIKQSLATKKAVTLTQLVQFVVLIVHSGWPLVSGVACVTHKFLLALCTIQNAFMLCLFGDFYVRAYVLRPRMKHD